MTLIYNIPDAKANPFRRTLDDYFEEAAKIKKDDDPSWQNFYDRLIGLNELSLVDFRDYASDKGDTKFNIPRKECIWYAMEFIMQENGYWLKTGTIKHFNILMEKEGYKAIPIDQVNPSEKHVVIYIGPPPPRLSHRDGNIALHYGILEHGMVTSKWDAGHIFQHRLDDIPTMYGKQAIIYKKISN